jgi:hypothetical protein
MVKGRHISLENGYLVRILSDILFFGYFNENNDDRFRGYV